MVFRLFESHDPGVVAEEIRKDYNLIYKEFVNRILPAVTRAGTAFVWIDHVALQYRDAPELHKNALIKALEDLRKLLGIAEKLDEKEERFVLRIEKDLRRFKTLGGESERMVKSDALINNYNQILDKLADILKRFVDIRNRLSVMRRFTEEDEHDKAYSSIVQLGNEIKSLKDISNEISEKLKIVNSATLELTAAV